MGNQAKVDELGFVTPEKILDPAKSHVFVRIPCKFNSSYQIYREPQDRYSRQQTTSGHECSFKLLDM
jgi:hypothetical protein